VFVLHRLFFSAIQTEDDLVIDERHASLDFAPILEILVSGRAQVRTALTSANDLKYSCCHRFYPFVPISAAEALSAVRPSAACG